jgi:hypothetical protein
MPRFFRVEGYCQPQPRFEYDRQPKVQVKRLLARLLDFIDVDNRVVASRKRKGQSANNDLHCVTSVGWECDLVVRQRLVADIS